MAEAGGAEMERELRERLQLDEYTQLVLFNSRVGPIHVLEWRAGHLDAHHERDCPGGCPAAAAAL